MRKQNLQKMVKAITLGLVLGTTLTATSSVWADELPIKKGSKDTSIIMNDTSESFGNKATGDYSTAFGNGTYAGAVNSGTTINVGTRSYTADKDYTGNSATAWGGQTLAIGNYSTAWGGETEAKGSHSTAWGHRSKAYGDYSTAFGLGSKAGGYNSLAALGGTTGKWNGDTYSSDGNNAVAIGSGAKALEMNSVALGTNAEARGNYSIALGYDAIADGEFSYSTALGHNSKAGGGDSFAAAGGTTGEWDGSTYKGTNDTNTGAYAIAIGEHAVAKENSSVAIGRYAQTGLGTKTTAKENEVITEFAVGGGTNGGKTYYSQITGVADGVNDHDAVNYRQLMDTFAASGTGEAFTELKDDVAGIHDDINGLNSQIDRMGTRIDKVGAGAAALAAMHPVYDEDSKLTFSAGLGAYRGEQAAAVGMFYRFTDRVMMNAGATVGNNDNMYNVGLNFALDRSVGSKLPSKAVMAKQLNAQNERIDALTAENQDMKKEIAELKAMVQALIANK